MGTQRNQLKNKLLQHLILSVCVTGLSAEAFAQDDIKLEEGGLYIEEIIVTAERREQNLQEISSSITVVTGQAIENMGLRNAQDLQNIVPGLIIRSSQIGNNEFSIRGVGASNEDVSTDSGVGVYVDDIYMARTSASNLTLFDLERVEVLRGPQGTLYGRNTAGGSINIITSKPTETFEGKIAIDVGDEGRLNGRAYVSGPLTDKLFAKASVASLSRDGIMKNLVDGSEGSDIDTQTGRLGFRYLPNDRTELLLTVDKEKTRQSGSFKSLGPEDGFFFFGGLVFPPGLPASDPVRTVSLNNSGSESFDTEGVMARVNIESESVTTSLIYGWREEQTFYDEDIDRSVENGLNEVHDEDGQWSSLELRVSSNEDGNWSADGALDWTAGLYAFKEDTDQTIQFHGTEAAFILCNFVFPDGACAIPAGEVPFGTFSELIYFQDIETDALAAYVHAAWSINEKLTVNGGLRYTDEDKTFTALTNTGDVVAPSIFHPLIQEDIDCTGNKDFNNVSGKLSVEYAFADDKMAYALFSQGYRSGGFNGQANDNAEACGGFDEETADNYEIGLKADWFDGRLRTNVSAFFMDYQDLQVSVRKFINGTPTTTNAADAEIKGAEFELWWHPIQNLSLNANIAVLDAVFTNFITFEDGELVDKSGDNIAEIPDLTYNFGIEYGLPLSNGAMLTFRGDYIFEGETKLVGSDIPEWNMTNFRVAYHAPKGNWTVAAWIHNAFDELYWTFGGPSNSAEDQASPRVLAEPRTVGVTLSYVFGD